MTPTARTLQFLRAQGHDAEVVEKWVRFSKPGNDPKLIGTPGVRRDFLGCFDIIALMDHHIVGIQCCAMSGRAAHELKLRSEPRLVRWLDAGGRAQLWSWRKLKVKRGGKALHWQHEVTPFAVVAEVPA